MKRTLRRKTQLAFPALFVAVCLVAGGQSGKTSTRLVSAESMPAIKWERISSKDGRLRAPGESTRQTGPLVGDFDRDRMNDVWINSKTGARPQPDQEAAKGRAGIGPSFKGPIGLQLYSLRAEFAKDAIGSLAKVRGMGFRDVEMGATYGLSPQQFRAELDKAGLRAVSMGVSFEQLRDNLDLVIRNAKIFGAQYVMCAWIPHQGAFTEAAARPAIQLFNQAGEKLKAAGISFAYHIHGYEFQPHGGGTLFDLLASELKPEYVNFELDVFWAFHGGQDPAALMRKYPRRFPLLHLKDMRKGEKGNLTGGAPEDWSVALGAGQIDFPAVLREAKKIGVKWYFVEEESHTPLENVPAGLRYLERVRF
jgi:sugar phosphate isomerase/epimerase